MPKIHLPASRTPWTADEDVYLIRGIMKHGVKWAKIFKDPSLKFSETRTNSLSLRDHFRNRFARVYRTLYSTEVENEYKISYLREMKKVMEEHDYDLSMHPDTMVSK